MAAQVGWSAVTTVPAGPRPLFLATSIDARDAGEGPAAALMRGACTVRLIDPGMASTGWQAHTTLADLRPACIEPAQYAPLMEQVLRRGEREVAVVGVVPPEPSPDTASVCVDIRLPTTAGTKASVTVASIHCTRVGSTAEAAALHGDVLAVASGLSRQLCDAEAEAGASAATAAKAQERCAELERAKAVDEARLLQGCLAVVNAKKARIRELTEELRGAVEQLDNPAAPAAAPVGGAQEVPVELEVVTSDEDDVGLEALAPPGPNSMADLLSIPM